MFSLEDQTAVLKVLHSPQMLIQYLPLLSWCDLND